MANKRQHDRELERSREEGQERTMWSGAKRGIMGGKGYNRASMQP